MYEQFHLTPWQAGRPRLLVESTLSLKYGVIYFVMVWDHRIQAWRKGQMTASTHEAEVKAIKTDLEAWTLPTLLDAIETQFL